MVIDLYAIVLLLGAAQGAFLALALLANRTGNRRANRYLAAYMLVFVTALVDYFCDATGLTQSFPWIRTLLWPKEFLYGVLLYLYCREMTTPGFTLSRPWRLALWLPPFVHASVTWPLLWLPPGLQYAILLNQAGLEGMYDLWRLLLGDIELAITMLHLTVMLVLCIRLLDRHQRRMRENFSSVEKISLSWLRYLLFGTLSVYFLWLLEEFLSADLLEGREGLDMALAISMVLLIYIMGWLGLRQPVIFSQGSAGATDDAVADPKAVVESPPDSKYARSALSAELAESLVGELRRLMQDGRLYLRGDLSLGELADMMSVSTNYLSQAINQCCDQNFFDFVNSYRVAHAEARITGTSDPLLTVAMDAGFNSKSAFYAAFRKHRGMTPGQCRKQFGTESLPS